MPQFNIRAGVPEIRRRTFDEDGDVIDLRGVSKRLKIRSSSAVHIYFDKQDSIDDVNYVDLPGPDNSFVWDAEVAVRYIWIKAQSGSADVELTASIGIGN